MSDGQRNLEERQRLAFGHFVDRMFWAVLTGVAIYAAAQLKELSDSVQEMKTQLAVGLSQVGFHEKRLDGQKLRIDILEEQMRHCVRRRD